MRSAAHDGGMVVVAGTDGSGKTAVVDRLVRDVLPQPVLHLHHRPGVLPQRTAASGPVTQPHLHEPYSVSLSVLKLVYLWADYLLGWMVRVRPHVRRGGWVLLERGWWDLAVDPRRYRLAPLPNLVRLASMFLPAPRATVVLRADPETLLQRKQELPEAELIRQQAAWGAVPAKRMNAVFVDAGRPLDDVVADVEAALRRP